MNHLMGIDDRLDSIVQGGAVTIGNFDGVHRGHRVLIDRLRKLAQEVNGPAVLFTFDPPPSQLLRPDNVPKPLTTIQRRSELLEKIGIEHVIVFQTSIDLLQLEPEQFFDQIIIQRLQAKAIVEGANFRFGQNRRGDTQLLQEMCSQSDIRCETIHPQLDNHDWISSSRIRKLVEQGEISDANQLLIEPYRISGVVVRGAARGRTLGFPTINLDSIQVLCPPPAVYSGRVVEWKRSASKDESPPANPVGLPVAINIGPNPTFGESKLKVEAHIIGYQGDLYSDSIAIEILEKLRNVQRFESKDSLLAQLATDIEQSTRIAQLP